MASQVPPRLITIKKYGNRRLYDTDTSRYITLEELAERICAGDEVRVVDARTAEDLTQATLVQIVLESRGAGRMLPAPLLIELIRLGDGALAEFLGTWMLWAFEGFASMRRAADKAQRLGAGGGMASLPWLGMMPGLSAWSGLGTGMWRGGRGRGRAGGDDGRRHSAGSGHSAQPQAAAGAGGDSDDEWVEGAADGGFDSDRHDHDASAPAAHGQRDRHEHAQHPEGAHREEPDHAENSRATPEAAPSASAGQAELAALRRELDALRARVEAASGAGADAAPQQATAGSTSAARKRPPTADPARPRRDR